MVRAAHIRPQIELGPVKLIVMKNHVEYHRHRRGIVGHYFIDVQSWLAISPY